MALSLLGNYLKQKNILHNSISETPAKQDKTTL